MHALTRDVAAKVVNWIGGLNPIFTSIREQPNKAFNPGSYPHARCETGTHVWGRGGSIWAACPQRAGVFPTELGVVRLCRRQCLHARAKNRAGLLCGAR